MIQFYNGVTWKRRRRGLRSRLGVEKKLPVRDARTKDDSMT